MLSVHTHPFACSGTVYFCFFSTNNLQCKVSCSLIEFYQFLPPIHSYCATTTQTWVDEEDSTLFGAMLMLLNVNFYHMKMPFSITNMLIKGGDCFKTTRCRERKKKVAPQWNWAYELRIWCSSAARYDGRPLAPAKAGVASAFVVVFSHYATLKCSIRSTVPG